MFKYQCHSCMFYTDLKSNYLRHCTTKKHARNHRKKEDDLEAQKQEFQKEKMRMELEFAKRETELTREKYESILRERDKIAKLQQSQVINQVTQNIDINLLNIVLPDMISLSQFIKNLQTTHQLSMDQTRQLLEHYNINVQSYGKCLSDTLRDNCYQQMISNQIQIPPTVKVLPLVKIDEESHKEKTDIEWKHAEDDKKLDQLIQTANDQVYHHHNSNIDLCSDDLVNVRHQIKSDNDMDQIRMELQQTMKQSIENLRQPLIGNGITSNTIVKTIKEEPEPVYNPSDKLRMILDCGKNYFVTTHYQVFSVDEPHKYVGRYIHDENCPCITSKNKKRRKEIDCWYYLDYIDEIARQQQTTI